MLDFKRQVDLRWSDLDPNFHLRHSVYYDFGAKLRMDYILSQGIPMSSFQIDHFGPILFREECTFRKEVKYGDVIFMSVKVAKLRKDYSRFTFLHEITKEDGTLCAILTVDGAWMDTIQRKLITPPQYIIDMCDNAPKPNDFQWIESTPK